MRKFFEMEAAGELPKGTAQRWLDETPNPKKLPERVKKKKSKKSSKGKSRKEFAKGFSKVASEDAAKSVHLKKEHKDPQGGLTAKGRSAYNKATGSNLKPGVRGEANTPEKMRRKGSWAVRFYGRKGPLPPLKKPNGEPTRFALTAAAWGEPVPGTEAAARRIGAKGRALLEKYRATREKTASESWNLPEEASEQSRFDQMQNGVPGATLREKAETGQARGRSTRTKGVLNEDRDMDSRYHQKSESARGGRATREGRER
jgi:hypothetical protein